MKELINKLVKLLDVKSIITIVLTFAFTVLTLNGYVTPDQYIMIYTVIISFYFGTQSNKQL